MRRLVVCVLATVQASCGTQLSESLKPPPSRTADYTVTVQLLAVYSDWTPEDLDRLTAQLGPAFAQAGVAVRILEPIMVQNDSWKRIDNELELREMMNGTYQGVRVWLVEDIASECLAARADFDGTAEIAGVSFPPLSKAHGVALATGAFQDRNTLVHELGHALGLSHPPESASACSIPEIACQFMSYCFASRNQFTASQIEMIRYWAAFYAN